MNDHFENKRNNSFLNDGNEMCCSRKMNGQKEKSGTCPSRFNYLSVQFFILYALKYAKNVSRFKINI